MVVTTEDIATKMLSIKNRNAKVEAGELFVPAYDTITPSKLKLLAECGWTIQDVWKESKGFTLLLTRSVILDEN